MRSYRTEVLGHIIEGRQYDIGRDIVLVDGRIVSTKWFGGWLLASHFIDITDAAGRLRAVEVSWVDRSKFGLGKYRMTVKVDGVEHAEVEPVDPTRTLGTCHNCGYDLRGVKAQDGEIKCPECGRHSSARLIDPSLIDRK